MSQKNPLNEHDYLVLVLARWLERNDYQVAADLEDRIKPPSLDGHKPDVFARQENSQVIGEAELPDRLCDAETQERWKAFFAATNRSSSEPTCELHIIVPSHCLEEAKQQAVAWGISAVFHTERLADQPGLAEEYD